MRKNSQKKFPRRAIFLGGNFPESNFLGWDFPGGNFQGRIFLGDIFPGGIFPRTIPGV